MNRQMITNKIIKQNMVFFIILEVIWMETEQFYYSSALFLNMLPWQRYAHVPPL